MEAPPGFEPGHEGFANLSLNHLGMAPAGGDYPPCATRQECFYRIQSIQSIFFEFQYGSTLW